MNCHRKRRSESHTWLDRFPIEIIFNIFDYLSTKDILFSFFYFNQRFQNVLMQKQHFLRSLELPTSKLYFGHTFYIILDHK